MAISTRIEELTPSGLALGRCDGLPVFIPGGVPGDQVAIKLTVKKKNHAFGQIINIIKPGPERIRPRCASFPACGGCQWQMLDHADQLKYKTKIVREAVKKIGRLDPGLVRETIGPSQPWFYRNKVQYPFGRSGQKLLLGYFRPNSHQIIDLVDCYIQEPVLTETAKAVRSVLSTFSLPVYDEDAGYGLLRHLVGRAAAGTGEILLGLVTTKPKLPYEPKLVEALRQNIEKVLARPEFNKFKLAGIVQNTNQEKTNFVFGSRSRLLWGRDRLKEQLGQLTIFLSLTAFHQVNHETAIKLYDFIEKNSRLTGRETVIDLYSGVGLISLWLARRAGTVFGIEENEAAVRDAEKNAQSNKITDCRFLAGRVEERLSGLIGRRIRPDLVILDPPRVGATEAALSKIVQLKAPRIIYVSCNPTTLARDLARLAQKSYRLELIQPFDMFPQTSHVEAVAILNRNGF